MYWLQPVEPHSSKYKHFSLEIIETNKTKTTTTNQSNCGLSSVLYQKFKLLEENVIKVWSRCSQICVFTHFRYILFLLKFILSTLHLYFLTNMYDEILFNEIYYFNMYTKNYNTVVNFSTLEPIRLISLDFYSLL